MASAQGSALGPFLLHADHIVFEGDAIGIVFLKPFFRGVYGGEDLEVLRIANLLGSVGTVTRIKIRDAA
jgi:hypothetical protein